MKRNYTLIIISCIAILASLKINAQPGTLDNTFGTGGIVTTSFRPLSDAANSVVMQPDGKIVVAGQTATNGNGADFALVRYNSNGTLDNTFGSGGMLTTSIINCHDYASSIAIQEDGKIIVAGETWNCSNEYPDFALIRYNTDGSLDNTFSGDGKVTTNFPSGILYSYDYGFSIIIQPDSKIILAGYSDYFYTNSDTVYFALARYNSNGTLDNTFGNNGTVTTALGNYGNHGHSVVLQPDGKIIVAGNASVGFGFDFGIVRYNSDGSLDATFGSGGKVITDLNNTHDVDVGWSVALQADGKIIVGGKTYLNINYYTFALARYNTDGTLDNTFGSGGVVTTDFGNYNTCYSVMVQQNGKIIATGLRFGSPYSFVLARYNIDGSLDNIFGSGGKVITDSGVFGSIHGGQGGGDGIALGATLQSDGKIVVASSGGVSGSNGDFMVARYNGDLTTGVNFNENNVDNLIYPNPTTGTITITGLTEKATATIMDATGRMVLAREVINNKVDVSLLANGVYLLRVETEKGLSNFRIMKQ